MDLPPKSFQTTQWTKVLSARDDTPAGKEALRALCEVYYEPVALFISRFLNSRNSEIVETDRDLTHAFFTKLLEGKLIASVDQSKGRFRTYLLGAVKHFLLDHRVHRNALKRGGNHHVVPLDMSTGENSEEGTLHVADPIGFPPDSYFDRQWAMSIIDSAMTALRQQASNDVDAQRFKVLSRWLVLPCDGTAVVEAAIQLSITENAFRVAIHRFRKEFRKAVADLIVSTLDDPAQLQEEMTYLLSALSHREEK